MNQNENTTEQLQDQDLTIKLSTMNKIIDKFHNHCIMVNHTPAQAQEFIQEISESVKTIQITPAPAPESPKQTKPKKDKK
ncbi:MAG: hypothetical protein GY861_11515 [bacterium]|nr:hypothetical protein [bacterium]